jgi:predicted aspartyl protease
MGLFRVPIEIASMQGGVPVSIPDALVDTGSEYTWVPRAALAAAGIVPRRTQAFIIAW